MFAKNRQLVLTGVFFLDAALLYASWIASYALRFYVLPLGAPLGVPRFSAYLWYGAVVVLAALLVLRSLRLYRSQRTARSGASGSSFASPSARSGGRGGISAASLSSGRGRSPAPWRGRCRRTPTSDSP
jgi:uncharacterized membrane protein YgcG